MMEFLYTCKDFTVGLLTSVWDLTTMVLTFCWDILYVLHMNHPRLEGLLVGIALVWLMLRRDKHPALRVLSAPLKLVLDILDMAWDHVVEIVTDAWDAVHGWVFGGLKWCWSKLIGVYNWKMGLLRKIKEKLSNK